MERRKPLTSLKWDKAPGKNEERVPCDAYSDPWLSSTLQLLLEL
jgi:hypothetical protein